MNIDKIPLAASVNDFTVTTGLREQSSRLIQEGFYEFQNHL